MYQMGTKYTKFFHSKAFQNGSKLGFLVWKYPIWQPWCGENKRVGVRSFARTRLSRKWELTCSSKCWPSCWGANPGSFDSRLFSAAKLCWHEMKKWPSLA
jgi:hypothetical protein